MASRGKHQTVKHTERNWSRVSRETNGVEGSLASLQLPRCGREFARQRWERTPRGGTRSRWAVGILRLRECFASRSTRSAQDDKLLEALSVEKCTLLFHTDH